MTNLKTMTIYPCLCYLQIQPFDLTKNTSSHANKKGRIIRHPVQLFPDENLENSFEHDEEAKNAILYGLERDDLVSKHF